MGSRVRRPRGISSTLAGLVAILIIVMGIIAYLTANLYYTSIMVRGVDVEQVHSKSEEVVKIAISYEQRVVTLPDGNKTVVYDTYIIFKSGWGGVSRINYYIVLGADGGVMDEGEMDPPLELYPFDTIRKRPSEVSPLLSAYDHDPFKMAEEVSQIIVHTELGNEYASFYDAPGGPIIIYGGEEGEGGPTTTTTGPTTTNPTTTTTNPTTTTTPTTIMTTECTTRSTTSTTTWTYTTCTPSTTVTTISSTTSTITTSGSTTYTGTAQYCGWWALGTSTIGTIVTLTTYVGGCVFCYVPCELIGGTCKAWVAKYRIGSDPPAPPDPANYPINLGTVSRVAATACMCVGGYYTKPNLPGFYETYNVVLIITEDCPDNWNPPSGCVVETYDFTGRMAVFYGGTLYKTTTYRLSTPITSTSTTTLCWLTSTTSTTTSLTTTCSTIIIMREGASTPIIACMVGPVVVVEAPAEDARPSQALDPSSIITLLAVAIAIAAVIRLRPLLGRAVSRHEG